MMYPYTAFARRQVQPARRAYAENTIGFLFANVQMTNRDVERLLAIVEREDPTSFSP
jgi:hypothetical protein